MPPKRAAPDAPSKAKKSRLSAEGADNAESSKPAPPRSKRWAAVSGSANADAEYRLFLQKSNTAYDFVCMCRLPFANGDEDEDEDEDDEDDEDDDDEGSDDAKKAKCDGGKTCLCDKPAAEHSDHVWIFSAAGKRKFFTQYTHFELRCPDNFNMYTFNDHTGYGVLEMLQNLILDFEEAAGSYKEQWAVCEALVLLLHTWMVDPVTGIDDGSAVDATYELVGRLFMSMLARLEREKLLSKDSEIKNLGLIMALFMDFAHNAREVGMLEESDPEPLGPAKDKKKWEPHASDDQILAYSRKYDIDLVGPSDIDDIIAEADGDVDLPVPESNNTAKADPFGFAKSLNKYKTEYGGITAMLAQMSNSAVPIGGDNLDITTWTSAKRKAKSFDKKDPLGKKEVEALKQGMVILRELFDVHLLAPFLLVREFVPAMVRRNHGHIVNIASLASFSTQASNVDYAASKAVSLLALHEGLKQEFKHIHMAPAVRATVVHPTWVRTPMIRELERTGKLGGPTLESTDVATAVTQQLFSGYGPSLLCLRA